MFTLTIIQSTQHPFTNVLRWNPDSKFKLRFEEHLKSVLMQVNKTIGLILKFRFHLPRNGLLTFDKSFARSHLGYSDVIYKKAYNESFHKNGIYSIQCSNFNNLYGQGYIIWEALLTTRFKIEAIVRKLYFL